jgi:hypothetical protein
MFPVESDRAAGWIPAAGAGSFLFFPALPPGQILGVQAEVSAAFLRQVLLSKQPFSLPVQVQPQAEAPSQASDSCAYQLPVRQRPVRAVLPRL